MIWIAVCTGLLVGKTLVHEWEKHLSMNVVGSHTSEGSVAHAWYAMVLLFPTHRKESDNTSTSVLNRCPIGDCN